MKSKIMLGLLCAAALLAAPISAFAKEDDPDDRADHVRKIVIKGAGGSFLGVGVADIDSDRARELDLKDEYGVEIKNVEDESPAAKAGLKEGDIVLEYNGERVDSSTELVRMVRETPAGRQVKLLVSRDGDVKTLTATIGTRKPRVFRWKSGDGARYEGLLREAPETPEAPDAPEAPEPPEAPEAMEDFDIEIPEIPEIDIPEIHIPDLQRHYMMWRGPRLGVETESLGPQLAEFFGVKEGVLVRSVLKGSAAEQAGLKAGDVITRVGDTKVSASGEISGALRSMSKDKSFPVTIVRNGKEMTLTAKLEEARKSGEGTPSLRRAPKARAIRLGRPGSLI